MKVSSKGRALPPRSTLLVGDQEACMQEWDKLQPEALAMLTSVQLQAATQHGSNSSTIARGQQQEWDSLVWRFRALRESLVSNYTTDTFAVQVYELSADVCAAARNFPELLKCLQGLVNELYHVNAGSGCSSRQPEMAAAQLLFFACTPSNPDKLDLWSVLHGCTTSVYWRTGQVQFAFQMVHALASSDIVRYFQLWQSAPTPLLKILVEAKLQQVRTYVIKAMATAFRTIPISAAMDMLCLTDAANAGHSCNSAPMPGGQREPDSGQVSGSSQSQIGGDAWGSDGTNTSGPKLAMGGSAGCDSAAFSGLLDLLQQTSKTGCRGATAALNALQTTSNHPLPAELTFR